MTTESAPDVSGSPLLARLARLNPQSASDPALHAPERDRRMIAARREILTEGSPIRDQRTLLGGWACRYRILDDGQRQILSFLLPGDLFGMCRHDKPIATTSILAITDVVFCAAPMAREGSELAEAYAQSAALDEAYLLAQITRLGRLDAYQRLGDWLLETQSRLETVGLATGDGFRLPLTQELLADALGLTSVHVNRTLRAMRRDGLILLDRGMLSFPDRDRLAELVSYKAPRISQRD